MRKLLLLPVLGMLALVPGTVAAQVPTPIQTLFLNARDPGGDSHAGPVTSRILRARVPYVLTVRGTVSLYRWRKRDVACGTPEARPIYRSRGARNGIVGADAEFVFAEKAAACAERRTAGDTVPGTWLGFKARQGRSRYFKLSLLTPTPEPRPDHTYRYPMLGYGTRAKFRLDDPNTRDNYGRLRLTLRRAGDGDCANEMYLAWGYESEAACTARALP